MDFPNDLDLDLDLLAIEEAALEGLPESSAAGISTVGCISTAASSFASVSSFASF